MKRLLLTDAGKLIAALEKSIEAGVNPSTPEEWERFMASMEDEGEAEEVGQVPDSTTAGYLAGSLRDEGLNARVLRKSKESKDAE